MFKYFALECRILLHFLRLKSQMPRYFMLLISYFRQYCHIHESTSHVNFQGKVLKELTGQFHSYSTQSHVSGAHDSSNGSSFLRHLVLSSTSLYE